MVQSDKKNLRSIMFSFYTKTTKSISLEASIQQIPGDWRGCMISNCEIPYHQLSDSWSQLTMAAMIITGKRRNPHLHCTEIVLCTNIVQYSSILLEMSNWTTTIITKQSIENICLFKWLILICQMRFGAKYFHPCHWHLRKMPLLHVNCGLGLFMKIQNYLDTS